MVGFAFLAKELQAFLVLPAFGLVYLICGPPRLGRRIAQLFALGVAMLAVGRVVGRVRSSSGPRRTGPYVGGSQNNSFFNVLFGYNGFGRLTGNESGSVGGGGGAGGTGRWGPTGWTRMFNDAFGGQISWLLPAALIFTVAGLAFTWKRPRTDRTRAALILWGATLFVTGVVFSLSKGIIHEYYTVALGPAIGALVGIGVATFWPHRDKPWARMVLGVVVVVSAFWANALLERTPDWNPWLRTFVLVGGCALAFTIAFGPALRGHAAAAASAPPRSWSVLAAPAAYTLSTVSPPRRAARSRSPDPASAGGFGRFGGARGGPGGLGGLAGGRPTFNGPGGGGFPGGGGAGLPGWRNRAGWTARRVAAVPRVGCSTGRRRVPRSPRCSRRGATDTGGSPPRSAPTARRATSSRPTRRSWPSVASTAPTPRQPSPSSRSSSPTVTSTTSSPAAAGSAAVVVDSAVAVVRHVEHVEPDQVVGREQLRLHHRRRRDRLRPQRPVGVAVPHQTGVSSTRNTRLTDAGSRRGRRFRRMHAMKIGLNGGAATVDRMVEQAVQTEAEGFSSLWYPSAVGGDPLVAMALAGRATTTLELGTAVLQTYSSHPALMANRVLAVVNAMGRNGFTLGIGPSHEPVIEGLVRDVVREPRPSHRGVRDDPRQAVARRSGGVPRRRLPRSPRRSRRSRRCDRAGARRRARTEAAARRRRGCRRHHPLDGQRARRRDARRAADPGGGRRRGRDAPRIVAGLPVAVHDDVDEARETAAKQFAMYGTLPNYRRILDHGGADGPADAAIVGDEAAVTAQIEAMFAAGATDMWAAIFPVGDDREGSRRRTRALLQELARS